jgi:hypothetical protein
MVRLQTLLITSAVALTLPLVSAVAQTPSHGTKCGPVAWSTEKMAYTSMPCAGGATGAASTNAVGNTTPSVAQTGSGVTSSSSMTKQEIKQESAAGSMVYGVPMGPSAVPSDSNYAAAPNMAAAPSMAAANDASCDANSASMKDEYGRKYNCRGDRVR